MKLVMQRQFRLNWPFRIDKIASAIVCLAMALSFDAVSYAKSLLKFI